MNWGELIQVAQKFGVFVYGFVRTGFWLVLVMVGFAGVAYIVRSPWHDDNFGDFYVEALKASGIIVGMTLIYTVGFWLFNRSLVVKLMAGGILMMSLLYTCSSGVCVESRYMSC